MGKKRNLAENKEATAGADVGESVTKKKKTRDKSNIQDEKATHNSQLSSQKDSSNNFKGNKKWQSKDKSQNSKRDKKSQSKGMHHNSKKDKTFRSKETGRDSSSKKQHSKQERQNTKSSEVAAKREIITPVKFQSTQSILTEKLKDAQMKRAPSNIDTGSFTALAMKGGNDTTGGIVPNIKLEQTKQNAKLIVGKQNKANDKEVANKGEQNSEKSKKKRKANKEERETDNSAKKSKVDHNRSNEGLSENIVTEDDVNDSVVNESVNDNNVNDDSDEEDPEKIAMRIKKREKRRQKKLEKKKRKQEQKEMAGTAKVSAVEYLDNWKNNRDEWKFLKVRQTWLLHNLYDESLINEERFTILLEYLDGIKGMARRATVKEAEKVVQENDDESDDVSTEENDKKETEESKTDADPVKLERARQIIQLLSD